MQYFIIYGIVFFRKESSILKQSQEAKKRWIRKTFVQKVTPRPEDLEKLGLLNTVLVKLWNSAVEQCNIWLEKPKGSTERQSITPISLNFWLTVIRNNDADINSAPVVLEREMLRRLAGGFASFFQLKKNNDSRARPPRVKIPEESFIALTWTQGSFSLTDNLLYATIGNKHRAVFILGDYINGILKGLPEGSIVAQVTISKRDGEFRANFVCNIPRVEPQIPIGIMAIDLGSGDIVLSCSDGKEYSIPTRRPDKRWRKEIFAVEERLENCVKNSRSWKRRMKARRVMHNKSLHQHTDHQRKVALWIVKQRMTVVVGKMNTRLGLAKSGGTADQHWGVQNTGYALRLLIFIKEKAAEHGLSVIELPDPRRKGDAANPDSKFHASRELLKQGCEKLSISLPSSFARMEHSIPQ